MGNRGISLSLNAPVRSSWGVLHQSQMSLSWGRHRNLPHKKILDCGMGVPPVLETMQHWSINKKKAGVSPALHFTFEPNIGLTSWPELGATVRVGSGSI
jgi:hypothetical protein